MTRTLPRTALAALALLLTLPFLGPRHHLPIATFHQEWLAGVLGLCALLALLPGRDERPWEIPHSAALPLALIVLVWLQLALGVDVLYAQVVLFSLYLSWGVLLMLVACRLEQSLGREALADGLAWSLLAGSLLQAASGALQMWLPQLGLPWIFPSNGRVIGNLAQANNFADYLWLGVVAASYLHARGKLPWPALLPALLPLIGLSLLSGSRSVYFYAIATSAWLLLGALLRAGDQRRRRLRVGLFLLAALFALQWLIGISAPGGNTVSSAQRLLASGSYDPVRLTLWRAALDIFADHPWLGAGFDSYSREFFARIEQFSIGGRGIPEHSHNLVTEFAAEFGLAGLALLVAAAGLWLRGAWRLRRRSDDASSLAVGCLLVVGIHSALEYPLWYAQFLAVAALMLALGDSRRWRIAAGGRRRLLLLGCTLLGLLVLSGLRSDYVQLEEGTQARRSDGQPLTAGEQQQLLAAVYAQSLWPHYAALQFAAHMPIDGERLDEKLVLMEEAMHFSPISAAVFRHAALLQLAGDETAARRQLRRAMLAYPQAIAGARNEIELAARDAPVLTPLLDMLRQRSF